MKISNERPPSVVLETANTVWGGIKPINIDDIMYTYGDTIYSSHKELSKDLIVHESTHQRQQGNDPDKWWKRYAIDLKFRYEQELEAYQNQYKYLVASKGKRVAYLYAVEFAKLISGHMYGNLTSTANAVYEIVNDTKTSIDN